MAKTHPYFNVMFVAGFLSACTYAYLAYRSQAYGQATLLDLGLCCSITTILGLYAWTHTHETGKHNLVITVLFWAIIFRIIGCFAIPVLEDDYFRYLWDGYQFFTTGSPYTHAPSVFFGNDNLSANFEAILDGINHPNIITIYAPVTQWLFALSYWIAPAQIWPLQLTLCLFDIGLIFILLRLAPIKYVWLYAWNPLAIKEIAFTAHPDIIGVLFLFAALLLYRKHLFIAAVLLALAVGSKIFAIIIAPLILSLHWRAWMTFLLALILICAPFINDFINMTEGLQSMAGLWLFNAPAYFLLLNIFNPTVLKLLSLTLFITLWCYYAWHYLKQKQSAPLIPRGDLLFALLLLCIPAMNPWYLIWLLPFAVIYPSYWAWTASIAVLLSYVIGLNLNTDTLEPYEQPLWAITLEYCCILIACLFDFYRNKRLSN